MDKLRDELARLLGKLEWTDDERRWLLQYLEKSNGSELQEILQQLFEFEKDRSEQTDVAIARQMLERIHEQIGLPKRIGKPRLTNLIIFRMAAASLIGLIAMGSYLLLQNDTKKEVGKTAIPNKSYRNNEISPGENKAVLTLADGSTIALDDAQDGDLTLQGNTKVFKFGGKLAYDPKKDGGNEVAYNTLTTPRGGQFQIALPDGSQVWLNAVSSLHFPTAFVGKERIVSVTGEAYFEVAKQTAMPFIVKVNGSEVQVKGTHFNVMAYPDEPSLKTTLLEGEVIFVHAGSKSSLKPGQQAQLTSGQVKTLRDVDVAEVVAWKNGNFDFEGATIESIAKQLSRWYDVEIVYEGVVADRFYANIPRSTKLADVLKALELTGKVHFRIEGRSVVARP